MSTKKFVAQICVAEIGRTSSNKVRPKVHIRIRQDFDRSLQLPLPSIYTSLPHFSALPTDTAMTTLNIDAPCFRPLTGWSLISDALRFADFCDGDVAALDSSGSDEITLVPELEDCSGYSSDDSSVSSDDSFDEFANDLFADDSTDSDEDEGRINHPAPLGWNDDSLDDAGGSHGRKERSPNQFGYAFGNFMKSSYYKKVLQPSVCERIHILSKDRSSAFRSRFCC
jgi:hypothetical protein